MQLTLALARAPDGGARAAVCTRRDGGVRRAERAVRPRAYGSRHAWLLDDEIEFLVERLSLVN